MIIWFQVVTKTEFIMAGLNSNSVSSIENCKRYLKLWQQGRKEITLIEDKSSFLKNNKGNGYLIKTLSFNEQSKLILVSSNVSDIFVILHLLITV